MIAFLLWFTFSMREIYTVVIEMPTLVTNLPDDTALERMPPQTARVHVQGQGWQLLQLYYNPHILPVNASENTEVDLLEAASVLSMPGGVVVQSVSPRTINLNTGSRVSRRIPVELRARIQPPPTYDLVDEPTISPDSITISGAQSLIEQLEAWPTEAVLIDQIRSTFSANVPLSDTLSRLVDKEQRVVTVSGRVEVFTEGREELEVIVRGAPTDVHNVVLYPSRVTVIYRVPLSQFDEAANHEGFVVSVSYNDILEDTTGTVIPEVELPPDLVIRDVRIEPRRLQYFMLIE